MNKIAVEKLLLIILIILGVSSFIVISSRSTSANLASAITRKREVDDTFSHAKLIQPGDETSAVFSSPVDKDYFSFKVDHPVIAKIELIHVPPNTHTQLYDPNKDLISESTVFQPVDDRVSELHLYRSGTYYIVLSNIGATQAHTPYAINLMFTNL